MMGRPQQLGGFTADSNNPDPECFASVLISIASTYLQIAQPEFSEYPISPRLDIAVPSIYLKLYNTLRVPFYTLLYYVQYYWYCEFGFTACFTVVGPLRGSPFGHLRLSVDLYDPKAIPGMGLNELCEKIKFPSSKDLKIHFQERKKVRNVGNS